jgi:putative hemolysin
LVARLARNGDEVRAAQRLRYRVFAEEMGARLDGPTGLDADAFDDRCDHLLLWDRSTANVVGTARLLPAARAGAHGFYSASEFALGRLVELPGVLEVGRACVDARRRTGAALAILLAGIAAYVRAGGHQHAIGCASVPVGSSLGPAARLCARVLRDHASPPALRVIPHHPFKVFAGGGEEAPPPTLLRAYLRMGAYVCGEPAWDDDFGTADLLVLLPVERLVQRYAQRLLRAA